MIDNMVEPLSSLSFSLFIVLGRHPTFVTGLNFMRLSLKLSFYLWFFSYINCALQFSCIDKLKLIFFYNILP